MGGRNDNYLDRRIDRCKHSSSYLICCSNVNFISGISMIACFKFSILITLNLILRSKFILFIFNYDTNIHLIFDI